MPKIERPHINPLGFREYDARWLYPKDINKEGIKNGTISDKTTRNQYIFNRWFQEQYLPSEGITYSVTKSEPSEVTKARQAINYNKSIGNDAGADEARRILKSLGYDPADYGL